MSGPDHPLGTGDTVVNRTDEVVMRIIKHVARWVCAWHIAGAQQISVDFICIPALDSIQGPVLKSWF